MADAVIGAIVDVSLSKAISILEEQINLAWEFKDELNKLRASLALTQAFLQDAVWRHLDAPLKVWLEQLRGIASETDDVLDELAYEHLRKKVEENQMRRKVSNFFSPSKNPMTFTVKMAKKVKKIKQSMDDINCQAAALGLQQRVQNMATPSIGVGDHTHYFGNSSQVIGREVDVKKVADLLTSSTNRQPFSIVSIEGMAGLGKTTLAKLVCNNERVKNRFNKIMWVCVAENFDVRRILQEMVESLSGQTCELKNRNNILEKLKTELKGKTYLLVLDDVWDVNFKNWEELRSSLLGINEDNKGSSILVTTRSENVALIRETLPENRHHLKALVDDECWSLIKERAFANSSISQELEVIGRDIARKCKGVPLVAIVIGGTMCNRRDKHEWLSIRDNSLWGSLERDETILSVLKLSYERLPSSSLKQCFVYCSVFPKDFRIQKKQLIQLWMAEGLLQQSQRNSMVVDEDIGDEYFMNLLSNSLLQDVELDEYGCISTCKMHDLVHDLARSIQDVQKLTPKIDSSHDIHKYKDDDSNVKLWHSLFLKTDANHAAGIFNGLRVLNFCDANIYSLPDSIGGLKHLRYFDISRTRISTVPKSLTELYHLQTLRFLMCHRLEKLPKGMKNLVSLRHLYISASSLLTAEIGCLSSLKTLPIFDVGECGIGLLGNLSALDGELELSNLQNVRNKEEAREARLWEKKKIHKLVYRWKLMPRVKIDEHKEVLDGLQPHSNLKSLTIECYKGGQFPSWFGGMGVNGSLSNLVELGLFFCKNLKSLPTLGQYLNLKFLRINGLQKVRRIGNEFYGTSDQNKTMFPRLEVFSLVDMGELEEWLEVEAAAEVPVLFPSLKELKIKQCHNLNSVPRMSRFSSLERLYLVRCSKLRWSTGDGPLLFPSSLRELTIQDCSNLNCIPSVEGGISSLQELYVGECEKLSAIEEGLFASTVLTNVFVFICPSLTSICFSGGLQSVEIKRCDELREIKCGLRLQKLKEFIVHSCANLVSIPSMEGFSLLSTLKIDGCKKLASLPSGLQTCTSLEHLCIRDCSNLKSIPEENLGSLTSLKILELGGFSEDLEEFPAFSGPFLSSVIDLRLTGWGKVSSLPQQIQHFTALEKLRIRKFHGIKALPEWLGNLSSLQEIRIQKCENLIFKEGKQRLFNLQGVHIFKWL